MKYKYALFFLLLSASSAYPMHMHVYFEDLFKTEPVPTEYTVYQLLKANPLHQDVNYVAIPWTVLINRNLLQHVPRIKVKGGFTVCQHISYERILPYLNYIGVEVLFTPHASRAKKYDGITVLPFPHVQKHGTDPAFKKDILYSLIGLRSHWTRAKLFEMTHPAHCIIKERKNFYFWLDQKSQHYFSNEYMDVLSRSRFALCPRGTGPSTIRFWEALQAGAIPVLIADDMSLPAEVDWDSVIVRVAEKDVHKIPAILARITPTQEKQMRVNCLAVHKQFSGINFVSTIRRYYKN